MLVHHADSGADGIRGGMNFDTLTTNEDFAFIWLVKTVEDVHQRGFPRAIFPK